MTYLIRKALDTAGLERCFAEKGSFYVEVKSKGGMMLDLITRRLRFGTISIPGLREESGVEGRSA